MPNIPIPLGQLIESLAVYSGTTSADGAAGGTTLIDAGLIGLNDFITEQVTVLIRDGACWREKRGATAFAPLTGTITFAAFTAQIVAGTNYKLLNTASLDAIIAIAGDVTAIKAVTDLLPDAGALTSIAQGIDLATTDGKVDAIKAVTDVLVTAKGVMQEAVKTIDLNQAAASYDMFTGTSQVVILESLIIAMPVGAAGGALTSISIQTNDATPQVLIPAAVGAVASLTSEAQLYWAGKIRIGVGKKIQLTIAGGATGAGYICNVNAEYRAVVNGGTLA
jgi:hypothetical protein